MKIDEIVNKNGVDEYIESFQKQNNHPTILSMENYAKNNHIPIIKSDVMNFLVTVLMIQKPKKILEIGTAIGYSSIIFAKTLKCDVEIDTLEINDEIIAVAKDNIKAFDFQDQINIIPGDALISLESIEKKYDFAFIDASKGHYQKFWDLIFPKMKNGGVIICDNLLIRGLVTMELENIPRKHRAHTRKMKVFIENLLKNEKVKTSILPIGDGLSISYIL